MFEMSKWLNRAAACGVAAGAIFVNSLCQAQETHAVEPTVTAPGVSARAALLAPTPPVSTGEKAGEPIGAPKIVDTGIPAAEQPKSAWLDAPLVHFPPRLGNFSVLPTGLGYYSALDWWNGEQREKAPKSAFPNFALSHPSFFDNDYRFVDDPKYTPDFLEKLHRVHLGDNWMFATGGQAWWRHMHEFNSRLTGKTNDYDLYRVRQYGDLWYRDTFRVYAEFISAGTANQDLPPLKIDENRADMLNLFFDVKLFDYNCRPAYLRVGRQELNLGSTRLISSLDWANTRRTFEGVRGFYLGEKVDVDMWWTNPVLVDNSRYDKPDRNQIFGGSYLSYKPQKGQQIDLYYLYLDNHNKTMAQGLVLAPTLTHTIGSRYVGDKQGYLWDFEGGVQLGQRGPQPLTAGYATAGLGYNWSALPMNPTVWAYYDWASGDQTPNTGSYNTFNQQFPFGHYYLGFIDAVGRQNIRDANFHLYLYPTKWITFNAQYHFFSLDSSRDALYGAAGQVLRFSPNGSAGGVVGQELDLLVNFHLSKRSDLLAGYSKLNAGEFISNTGNGRSPELWYLMYNVRW